jgi:hypothetical protein
MALAEEMHDIGHGDELRERIGDGPRPFQEKSRLLQKPSRNFEPWHRPRKQYVRRCQWAKEIKDLVRDLELEEGDVLRYLTLPGKDLLDIRYLADTICAQSKILLKYLGFNTAAAPSNSEQSELNANEFSIKRRDDIHPESQVFSGDFRKVGDVKSDSWRRACCLEPFHVINLDLCGGFAGREKSDGIPNYFTALQALLQSQAKAQQDFLLFITSRMDDANIDQKKQEILNDVVQQIHKACSGYSSAFAAAWNTSGNDAQLPITETVGTAEAFMLGLTQWIVSQGIPEGLQAKVKSFMTYRTGLELADDNIVSLAIRFKPNPVIRPDPGRLVKTTDSQSFEYRTCEQSAIIPTKVKDCVRIDCILQNQTAEFNQCFNESAELLKAAGYDEVRYRDWVTSGSSADPALRHQIAGDGVSEKPTA